MSCNCENLDCEHKDQACKQKADPRYRLKYVGGVCEVCYFKMPEKYRIKVKQ